MSINQNLVGLSWRDLYCQRLKEDGLDPELILTQALCRRDSQGNPQEHPQDSLSSLFSLAQCLKNPDLLIQQVRNDYSAAATAQLQRAYLSVIHQDLALSVIAPLTLQLFRDGKVRLPSPNQIFLAPLEREGQTTSRWFSVVGQTEVDEQGFMAHMSEITTNWYPFFRRTLGVSPGSYWSSTGLGLGAPFSAVWNLAQPEATCHLAQSWLKAFENEANRFVDWIPFPFNDQNSALPQRRGCCLQYLLPNTGYCGTCGVYRKERMKFIKPHPPASPPEECQPPPNAL